MSCYPRLAADDKISETELHRLMFDLGLSGPALAKAIELRSQERLNRKLTP